MLETTYVSQLRSKNNFKELNNMGKYYFQSTKKIKIYIQNYFHQFLGIDTFHGVQSFDLFLKMRKILIRVTIVFFIPGD